MDIDIYARALLLCASVCTFVAVLGMYLKSHQCYNLLSINGGISAAITTITRWQLSQLPKILMNDFTTHACTYIITK